MRTLLYFHQEDLSPGLDHEPLFSPPSPKQTPSPNPPDDKVTHAAWLFLCLCLRGLIMDNHAETLALLYSPLNSVAVSRFTILPVSCSQDNGSTQHMDDLFDILIQTGGEC